MDDEESNNHDVSTAAVQSQYPAFPSDWEEQRGNIQRLYCTEEKPLPLVMAEMRKLCRFQATERQYKRRITAWNLDKNIKDGDMRAMLRVQRHRKGEGKASAFLVRGRPVNPKKMARFRQRKGNEDNYIAGDILTDLPPHVRCYTPMRESKEPGRKLTNVSAVGVACQHDTSPWADPRMEVPLEPPKFPPFRSPRGNEAYVDGQKEVDWPSFGAGPEMLPFTGLVTSDGNEYMSPLIRGHQPIDRIAPSSSPDKAKETALCGSGDETIDAEISRGDDSKVATNKPDDENARRQLEADRENIAYLDRHYQRGISPMIPKSFSPLPEILSSNGVNLWYFQYFINNTSRLLVGHDCPSNPFRTILPKMALAERGLMNVLLAYSASHRAESMKSRWEEANRIDSYVRIANHDLRMALDNPRSNTNPATLAVLLMLVSMSLTCSSSSEAKGLQNTQWHVHLKAARNLIDTSSARAQHRLPAACSFLIRWFLQLESMKRPDNIRDNNPLIFDMFGHESWRSPSVTGRLDRMDTYLDCLWGVSLRCLIKVTKVAQMATMTSLDLTVDETSLNGPVTIKLEAMALQWELISHAEENMPYTSDCQLVADGQAHCEMIATNRAYHWAALIHLNRHVLQRPSTHPDVQKAVKKILQLLQIFRELKNILLFPTITAGFEAQTPEDKELVFKYCKILESNGFPTVRNARRQVLLAHGARATDEKIWDDTRILERCIC